MSRYIIGIDLGTTNSTVSYVDKEDPSLAIRKFLIPQLVAPGLVKALPSLPSFCYLAAKEEGPFEAFSLPWKKTPLDFFVGAFAKEQGGKVPTRLVHSAKSWLCHTNAVRKDPLLPLESGPLERRLSPKEATCRYLRHLREAWDFNFLKKDPKQAFDQQEVVLGVPASFDEVARILTVQAAKEAGFGHVTLLEEPLAAFYSWMASHQKTKDSFFSKGDLILICDVGGGTTDFSLIEVEEKGGEKGFNRLAVGDHLLLGGDNMDAALSYLIEKKHDFSKQERLKILHLAREAKETLLKGERQVYQGVLQGKGQKIVGGSRFFSLTAQEVMSCLLEGFFPLFSFQEALLKNRSSGIKNGELPYETEPAITKHLAHFLNQSLKGREGPKYVLFNGCSMEPKAFQDRVLQSLSLWFPQRLVKSLPVNSLASSVSFGAAAFGKARLGFGLKLRSGLSRTLYLEVGSQEAEKPVALTLLAKGSEEGMSFVAPQPFLLTPNTPVSFQLYRSNVRIHDAPGDLIPIQEEELQKLPPLQTSFRFGKGLKQKEPIFVFLKATLSTIGTLELKLEAKETSHEWLLEFQLKTAQGIENQLEELAKKREEETLSFEVIECCQNIIKDVFLNSSKEGLDGLFPLLEKQIDQSKQTWSASTLRLFFDALLTVAEQREQTPFHLLRFWNFVGWTLRPGCGYPLDDHRIKTIWKIWLQDSSKFTSIDFMLQLAIATRRFSGGLNAGQQAQVASFFSWDLKRPKNKKEGYFYEEKIRSLASLELLSLSQKIKWGEKILTIIQKDPLPCLCIALARLGARQLSFGSFVYVIPKDVVEKWIGRVLKAPCLDSEKALICLHLAKKVAEESLNVSKQCVEQILTFFKETKHDLALEEALTKEGQISSKEAEVLLGDFLPPGLVLFDGDEV